MYTNGNRQIAATGISIYKERMHLGLILFNRYVQMIPSRLDDAANHKSYENDLPHQCNVAPTMNVKQYVRDKTYYYEHHLKIWPNMEKLERQMPTLEIQLHARISV